MALVIYDEEVKAMKAALKAFRRHSRVMHAELSRGTGSRKTRELQYQLRVCHVADRSICEYMREQVGMSVEDLITLG